MSESVGSLSVSGRNPRETVDVGVGVDMGGGGDWGRDGVLTEWMELEGQRVKIQGPPEIIKVSGDRMTECKTTGNCRDH